MDSRHRNRVTLNLRTNQALVLHLRSTADILAKEIAQLLDNAIGDRVDMLARDVSKAALTEAAHILTQEYVRAVQRKLQSRHPLSQVVSTPRGPFLP